MTGVGRWRPHVEPQPYTTISTPVAVETATLVTVSLFGLTHPKRTAIQSREAQGSTLASADATRAFRQAHLHAIPSPSPTTTRVQPSLRLLPACRRVPIVAVALPSSTGSPPFSFR